MKRNSKRNLLRKIRMLENSKQIKTNYLKKSLKQRKRKSRPKLLRGNDWDLRLTKQTKQKLLDSQIQSWFKIEISQTIVNNWNKRKIENRNDGNRKKRRKKRRKKSLSSSNKDKKTAREILKPWKRKPATEQNELLRDERHQQLISKAFKEAFNSESDQSKAEDKRKEKEGKEEETLKKEKNS